MKMFAPGWWKQRNMTGVFALLCAVRCANSLALAGTRSRSLGGNGGYRSPPKRIRNAQHSVRANDALDKDSGIKTVKETQIGRRQKTKLHPPLWCYSPQISRIITTTDTTTSESGQLHVPHDGNCSVFCFAHSCCHFVCFVKPNVGNHWQVDNDHTLIAHIKWWLHVHNLCVYYWSR